MCSSEIPFRKDIKSIHARFRTLFFFSSGTNIYIILCASCHLCSFPSENMTTIFQTFVRQHMIHVLAGVYRFRYPFRKNILNIQKICISSFFLSFRIPNAHSFPKYQTLCDANLKLFCSWFFLETLGISELTEVQICVVVKLNAYNIRPHRTFSNRDEMVKSSSSSFESVMPSILCIYISTCVYMIFIHIMH